MNEPAIISDPAILGGKPILAGTRIAVSTILDLLAAGLTADEVQKEYPGLSKKAIHAAISFASARVRRETISPIVDDHGSMIFPTV
ncbi:MAG: DUF433 domain-containing protein [Patescibacteria group bacterium]